MRILLVISEAPPVKSGVARVAEKLSAGLGERGFDVEILSVGDIPRLEWGEIRLSSMPLKLRNLRNYLKQYDVIHLHGPVPTFSDIFLLWGLRDMGCEKPYLVYTHHAPVEFKTQIARPFLSVYNHFQEQWSNLADHIVATTPSYGQRLSRYVTADKLSVIPWGVDFEKFYTPVEEKRDPFTVLFLGQIRPYKGLPVLLEAARQMEDTRFWIIGDGHYSEHCRQLARDYRIHDITFWGLLPDDEMLCLIKQAHVIVLPSITRSEAFGIALLEGMAAGLVPVASHLPGVADLVGNEGITFPPGKANALLQILLRLRNDASLRNHLALIAQEKARLYPWERSVFGYERIFTQFGSIPVQIPRLREAVREPYYPTRL